MITFYAYKNCGTCRKARKYLESKQIDFQEKAIRDTPPPPEELSQMLAAYEGKMTRLFNTSSQDYRDANLKENLSALSKDQAFALLQENGNLVKRPFLIGEGLTVVGFKEAEWEEQLQRLESGDE